MEYANSVGADISDLQASAGGVVSSVNTAITWVQKKFNSIEELAREQSAIFSDAASSFNEFFKGLADCCESLDASEKGFWQAVRKLLAAGVDVNPRSDTSSRAPLSPDLITDPMLVRDQASSLFALDADLVRLKHVLAVSVSSSHHSKQVEFSWLISLIFISDSR